MEENRTFQDLMCKNNTTAQTECVDYICLCPTKNIEVNPLVQQEGRTRTKCREPIIRITSFKIHTMREQILTDIF